jgi:hypothetical protein
MSTTSDQHTYTSFEFLQKHEQQLPRLIPFVHDVNTYQALSSVLTHIQLLWELILLNEPIAILGTFPTNCSQTVQALGKSPYSWAHCCHVKYASGDSPAVPFSHTFTLVCR